MPKTLDVDCCVAGGGPAGMMAGLLFARAGCKTVVLEKHQDFLRDFRGDTVHPSTLEVLRELRLLDAFLTRPHQALSKLSGIFGRQTLQIADFSSIKAACHFVVFMPQWHFLDFLGEAAAGLPHFSLAMHTEATGLIAESGRITGVKAKAADGPLEIRARLTIGADGRHSTLRKAAGFDVVDVGAPIDVMWFRLTRLPNSPTDEPLFNAGPGHIVVTIDRGDYYQCALIIPKGRAEQIKAKGLDAFRQIVTATAPRLAKTIGSLASLDDIKLLSVTIDRLSTWSRPGLLVIGDAAHAMSPVGGVGINLAIQDAVAAANLLAEPLANAQLSDDMLDRVRQRRAWPVKATQAAQVIFQRRIISPLLAESSVMPRPPLALRIVSRLPPLQRLAASLIGLGVRPEHVHVPERERLRVPAASDQHSPG